MRHVNAENKIHPHDDVDEEEPLQRDSSTNLTHSEKEILDNEAILVNNLHIMETLNYLYYFVVDTFTYQNIKVITKWFLDSATLNVKLSFDDLMMILTLFVLFGDSIKIMTADNSADVPFVTANSICLFFFIFEFFASTWSKTKYISIFPVFLTEGYLFSFFWWLDLLAILSMFPDISWIANPLGMGGLSNAVSGNSNLTKAGRVVRLVRLVRLVRIYKIATEKRKRKRQEEELLQLVRVGAISYDELESQRSLYNERQSKLGLQLSESITRRVIVIVLIMLVILPLISDQTNDAGPEYSFAVLHDMNVNPDTNSASFTAVIDQFITSYTDSYYNHFLIYLYISSYKTTPIINDVDFLETLRTSSKTDYITKTIVDGTEYTTHAIFNNDSILQLSAEYSIILTIFVGVMLVLGASIFTADAQRLVIAPIERMMNLVEAVAKNPLQAFKMDPANSGEYETKLLESTVEKITSLLRVGFGEAGAGIISANLASGDGSTSINPLLPGIRIYAIVGFCDIHHYEEVLVNLRHDVLTFVNTIAEIVHDRVHTWGGQVNKNLGNAFVVIWRIGDEQTIRDQLQGQTKSRHSIDFGSSDSPDKSGGGNGSNKNLIASRASFSSRALQSSENSFTDGSESPSQKSRKNQVINLQRVPGIDIMADKALIGYLKIIAEINRSRAILRYRDEPRLTCNGTQEFKVRMGFGMHAGWAIEGAVGSIQKVDATYLSPHVNMAARLETSSRQYGVPLLCSQMFYELLSLEAQNTCRKLDIVTVKGSEVPIAIYTYDALQDQEFRIDTSANNGNNNYSSTKRRASVNSVSSNIDSAGGPGALDEDNINTTAANTPAHRDSDTQLNLQIVTPNRRPSVQSVDNNNNGTQTGVMSPATAAAGPSKQDAVFMTPNDEPCEAFENDCDLLQLRQHVSNEFLEVFAEGVTTYLDGNWPGARIRLEEANEMMLIAAPSHGGDGPSLTLLKYMENHNWAAPITWKGYRPLTSK